MAAPPPFPPQEQVLLMPLEEIITDSATKKAAANRSPPEERRSVRAAEKEKGIKFPCPRCNSTNTKFCYYNNYSLRQPRYLCKACKRYWTQGGSLRSIPVGGTTRKNKFRSSSSSSSSPSSSAKIIKQLPHLVESSNDDVTVPTNPNPKLVTPNYLLQFPTVEAHFINQQYISAVELLTAGMPPMPEASYRNSAYPVGLSLDGIASVWGTGRRVLFPFEEFSSTATTAATTVTATADSLNAANANHHHQEHRRDDHDQLGDSTGYWTRNMYGIIN